MLSALSQKVLLRHVQFYERKLEFIKLSVSTTQERIKTIYRDVVECGPEKLLTGKSH